MIGLSRHTIEGISLTAASRDLTIEVGAAHQDPLPSHATQSLIPGPLLSPTVLVLPPSPTYQAQF